MTQPYTLTETTLEIFKNFSNINSEVTFKSGNFQRTCNQTRNFIADVELADALPVEFSLYELNRLLGIIDTCKGASLPSILFGEKSLTVIHEHGEVNIPYAHSDVVTKLPDQKFHMEKEIATFQLPLSLWSKMKRTASILDATSLYIIVNDEGKLQVKLVNEKDTSGNSSGIATYDMPSSVVNDTTPNTWAVKFDVLAFLPGDYTVSVGEIGTTTGNRTVFGMFFTLNDPLRKVTYLTSGHVVKTR